MNYAHHYEFTESGLNINDIRKFISERRIVYDYIVDQKKFKWSGKSRLNKMDSSLLPDYVTNNFSKYSEWLD